MIKRNDVIRIKVPFPGLTSGLAKKAHMYICREADGPTHRFVKCQTLKPQMLTSNLMRHYWDEAPDLTRNPFTRTTRIDCDKDFLTTGVTYHDALKTTARPDVCDDVLIHVEEELFCDGYDTHPIDEAALQTLNTLVTPL